MAIRTRLGAMVVGLFGAVMAQPNLGIEEAMRPRERPLVIAHRGFSGVAPENTLAAFEKAIEAGADMIELDVLLSKDGHVVVIHDDTLDRTTNGTGPVDARTLSELQKLDAGSWFSGAFAGQRIPTLEQALQLAKNRILVNVEIKTEGVAEGLAEKALRVVRASGMESQVVFSSFNPRALEQIRRLAPDALTASLRSREHHQDMAPKAVMDAVGSNGLNLSMRDVDAATVAACHALDRPIAVYTVNELNDLERIVGLGVDAIFTDYPDRLIGLLDR